MESVSEPDVIGNVSEEDVDLASKNIEVESDDIHELLDSPNQELIEMLEQQKDCEERKSLDTAHTDNCVVFVTYDTWSTDTSDQGQRYLSRQRSTFTPVVCRSFENHTGDSVIGLDSTPILKNTLRVDRGLPSFCPFHQPHERTCVSKAF
ncbi:hypothetical protein TNCV_3026951 [Trichonephila clavipes]|nr:hypothetical protein TNCV_3026951 [Trichonephila clavipes]